MPGERKESRRCTVLFGEGPSRAQNTPAKLWHRTTEQIVFALAAWMESIFHGKLGSRLQGWSKPRTRVEIRCIEIHCVILRTGVGSALWPWGQDTRFRSCQVHKTRDAGPFRGQATWAAFSVFLPRQLWRVNRLVEAVLDSTAHGCCIARLTILRPTRADLLPNNAYNIHGTSKQIASVEPPETPTGIMVAFRS